MPCGSFLMCSSFNHKTKDKCDCFYHPYIFPGDKIKPLHLRPNQGSFTTGSLHFSFSLLYDHHWFYVTFPSSWLLKWDLTFHALSRGATMTGLRTTHKKHPWAGIYWMLLWLGGLVLHSWHQSILETTSFLCGSHHCYCLYWYSFPSSEAFVIRAVFMDSQVAFRSTKLFFCPRCESLPLLPLSSPVCLN